MQPDRAQLFTKSADSTLWLLIYAAAAIALMVLDRRFGYLNDFRRFAVETVRPIWRIAELPEQAWRVSQSYVQDREALAQKALEFEQQALTLAVENQNLRARLIRDAEIAQLSALQIDRGQIVRLRTIDLGKRHRFTIDKGTTAGIVQGTVLLDRLGIVGQVEVASPSHAIAISIADPAHRLPVRIARNGLRLLVSGDGSSSQLIVDPLMVTSDVKVGDVLLSSGLGGIFPEGHAVGVIRDIKLEAGAGFAIALVTPAADLQLSHQYLYAVSPTPRVGPLPQSVLEKSTNSNHISLLTEPAR
jgi:rod shape-determining protein MreC